MERNQIAEEAARASAEYYDYLSRTGKGRVVYEVASVLAISYKKKKGKDVYRLNLTRRLRGLDNVYVEINGVKAEDGDVELIMWDEDKRDLVIAVSKEGKTAALGALDALDLNAIVVVTDMKYLVERVQKWFVAKPLFIPKSACLRIKRDDVKLSDGCSDDQAEAVRFALTHPFSYVWGAPGTGKTKYVLANCVMNYLLRGEKVYVIAPTNNAVEQALGAVVELVDSLNIPRGNVLRLGAPSREFADKYPEVCELDGLNYLVKTRKEKEEFLGEVLDYKRKLKEIAKLRASAEEEIARLVWEAHSDRIVDGPPDLSLLNSIVNFSSLHLGILLKTADLDGTISQVTEALNEFEKNFRDENSVYSAYDEDDESDISDRLAAIESDGEKRKKPENKIKEAKVVGATIDGFIGEFSGDGEEETPRVGAAHIFLDEAGYSNTVKALTLFSEMQPVTFFGDHFQLPPICEMDDDTISRESPGVTLWAQSALYIGDLMNGSMQEFCSKYFLGDAPSFELMPKTDLPTTYRFGQNLLDVLAKRVYGTRLESVKGKDNLIIEFIDAPKRTEGEKKRENPDEARAIRGWLKVNGFSKRKEQSVAVLAPYKNQVYALKKCCFPYVGDEIYSIHGSQGREWDTVVLSVCDTDDMYFVNSENRRSKGRLILNTAISRAKKRLVIACDYSFWSRRGGQLITELLGIASSGTLDVF